MLELVLYWGSLTIILYTYFGYGILIYVLSALKKKNQPDPIAVFPSLTIIIPAFNEAAVLGHKIRNTLEQQYPREQLEVLVVTDGSTDGSERIVQAFPQVTLLHDNQRWGKAEAINRAMKLVKTDLALLTDANTELSAGSLALLVRRFSDPKVGGVSGEKKVLEEGEGLYWRYESFLKKKDAELGTLVGAAGELFAFRTSLFEPLEPDTVLDDFVLSLRICQKGYKVDYEPDASALEAGSVSLREEEKRKIRIAAGGVQAMRRLPGLFRFDRHPMLSFQYLSHRVLRWTLAPICLPIFFFSNALLLFQQASGWFLFTFIGQLIFYGMALVGWIASRKNRKLPIVFLLYYFLFMNLAVIKGWYRFWRKGASGRWEKSERLSLPIK